MIKIDLWKNNQNELTGFRLEGHAGLSKKGHDILCAAVSMLAINTVNSIEKFASDDIEVIQNEKKGILELRVVSEVSHDTDLLLKTFQLGVSELAKQYGSKFIVLTNS